eukprot:364278-Chlamydomonas_euryale.AAC.3
MYAAVRIHTHAQNGSAVPCRTVSVRRPAAESPCASGMSLKSAITTEKSSMKPTVNFTGAGSAAPAAASPPSDALPSASAAPIACRMCQ